MNLINLSYQTTLFTLVCVIARVFVMQRFFLGYVLENRRILTMVGKVNELHQKCCGMILNKIIE